MKKAKKKDYFNAGAVITIILLGIIVYSNSFNCSFHFDDLMNIVDNPKIKNLSDISAWWNFVPSRPVGNFTFALNYHFNQLDVKYWHLVNLIIHVINAMLVWWISLRIFSTPSMKGLPVVKQKKIFALCAALLFVSHPLATQSVTYIVQRLASLVAMFYLGSVALYLNGRLEKPGSTGSYFFFSGSFVSAVLAMMTKENAFTLPFAIILTELFFFRTKKLSINFKDYRIILAIAALLSIIIIIPLKFSLSVFDPIAPQQGHAYTMTWQHYLFTQFSVIVKYIQLLFLPVNQKLDYDFPIAETFFGLRTILSFLFLAALLTLAVFLFRKHRLISFGISWFFLTLLVESSIIPIPNVIFEHRTYLPSVGYVIAVTAILFGLLLPGKRILALVIMVMMVIFYSFLTYERNKVWKDDISLWLDNVKKCPNLARPYTNLGKAKSVAGDLQGGLDDYNKAIAINPKYGVALFNRGVTRAIMKDYMGAISDYNKAIEYDTADISVLVNRGNARTNINDNKGALEDYAQALKLEPSNPDIYLNVAIAQQNLGDFPAAIKSLGTAIRLRANFPQAYLRLGIINSLMHDNDAAVKNLSEAIKGDPGSTDAWKNRGIVYINQGNYVEAVNDFSKALEIKQDDAETWFMKAEALMKANKPAESIPCYAKAVSINPGYYVAWMEKAMIEFNLKDYTNAINDLTSAIAINPQSAGAYKDRGTNRFYLKDMKGACADWKKALELGNKDVLPYLQTYCK
jgi:protein O-mannosyl-transferase